MKTMGRFLATSIAAISLAGPVMAAAPDEAEVSIFREQPRSYAGPSIVQFNLDSDLVDQQPGGLMVRLGGRFDDHYGAEVKIGAGLWHEAQRDGLPGSVKKLVMDVDYVVGGYFTGRWGWQLPYVRVPMIRQFYVDAQVGLAALQVSAEAETFSNLSSDADWDGTSLSYGLGLGFDFDLPFLGVPAAAGLQYMSYGSLEDVPSNGDDLDISSLEGSLQIFF